MKRLAAGTVGALVALCLAYATAGAQGTKTVRGEATKVAPDSITVQVGGQSMTFKVDAKTRVTARGGSTAAREAKAEGKPGVAITELVKTGSGVEVAYHEAGMHADSVRLLPGVPPPPAPPGPQATSSSGVVTAVSASSLTIKASSGELTFTIDEKTKVVGTGMGTQSQKMKQAGQTTQITDFVSNGDMVTVRSTEAGGVRRASEVRVTKKAT